MTREWKPGDVALVRNEYDVWNVAICAVRAGRSSWVWEYGVADAEEHLAAEARPLVVIDPEDAEQVERFTDTWVHARSGHDFGNAYPGEVEHMQAALREFANPTPPKPDEPTGLGAVVVDDEGRRWVRLGEIGADDWRRSGLAGGQRGEWTRYDQIAAVRVLSEGVQP